MHEPQERLSLSCSKCLPSLFCLLHPTILELSQNHCFRNLAPPAFGSGFSIVYVVSGYVQMGLFGWECVRAHIRACVNSYICFCMAYLNGANAKETLL